MFLLISLLNIAVNSFYVTPEQCHYGDGGQGHFCALTKPAGNVVCWSTYDGHKQVSEAPTDDNYFAITSGMAHSCALRATQPGGVAPGTIACWGSNSYSLKDNVPAGNFVAVSAGGDQTCALGEDKKLACWGYNYRGQGEVPTEIAGSDFIAIACQTNANCAIRTNGELYCWGGDTYKEQTDMPSGNDFIMVTGGQYHACALKRTGEVVCWGRDYESQVSNTPTETDFIDISSGERTNCGLRSDYSIVCWGDNVSQQVSNAPIDADFYGVWSGRNFHCAPRRDGSVQCWGDNSYNTVTSAPSGNDIMTCPNGVPRNVNHPNINPGVYTCNTVLPEALCLGDGECKITDACPGMDGTSSCKGWCEGQVAHWTRKCTWTGCAGCNDCGFDYNDKANCKPWCHANAQNWGLKCTWADCMRCEGCLIA